MIEPIKINDTCYILKDGDLYRETKTEIELDYTTPAVVVEHDIVLRRATLLSMGLDLPRNGKVAIIE